MSDQTVKAMSVGLQLMGGIVDNILFAAAFHHHTVKGVDFDEALDHTLHCLAATKTRIPQFIDEQRKAREQAAAEKSGE